METRHNQRTGHIAALVTVSIWGTTYISTKVLLQTFRPAEVLFFRFIIGFIVLWMVNPRRLKIDDKRREILFVLAGLCGVCLYSLLENIALSFTMASNVGVIICAAPFFTAIFTHILMKQEEKLRINFFIGFVLAMAGIYLITFHGSAMELNPVGDLLAILATVVWGGYCVITKKISSYGYNTIQTTRRIFGYGILFIVPALFFLDFNPNLEGFAAPVNLFNIVFLGLGASALCYVTWNYSVKVLGPIKTSVYIYLEPVITVVTSVLVLRERITPLAALGTAMTLAGLITSEIRFKKKEKRTLQNHRNYGFAAFFYKIFLNCCAFFATVSFIRQNRPWFPLKIYVRDIIISTNSIKIMSKLKLCFGA